MTYEEILQMYPYLAHIIHMYQGGAVGNYASGGLVGGNSPFSAKNGILSGGLNLMHPSNNANAPLDIQWNVNNMIQSGRARPQGQI